MGLIEALRIVYLGTPAFAVPTLEALVAEGHEIVEVITQPDRPKGRQQTLNASPVKVAAQNLNLPIYQPERIRRPESIEHLRALAPDLMVIVGYGQIIPQNIIDIPPRGIINVHASLLPKLRGAAPIQWSIANGDRVTGVTTMQIDAGLDTGAMLLKAETEIRPNETAIELSVRLAPMGAELLIRTIMHNPTPRPQDNSQSTLAPMLKKEDGRIDWLRSAKDIHNRIRGFQPWPGGYTTFRGSNLQLWKVHNHAQSTNLPPGSIFPNSPHIACGQGTVLEVVEVQLEGRKRVTARDFWNGLRFTDNEILGASSI